MVRLNVKTVRRRLIYMTFYNLFFALSIRQGPIYKRFIVKRTKIAHISIKSAKNLVNIAVFYAGPKLLLKPEKEKDTDEGMSVS